MLPNLKSQVKICPSCGLNFHNRKKWQARGLWEKIIYCSKRCRQKKLNRKHESTS